MNNKKWVTLLETILYLWIFMVALTLLFAIVISVIKINKNTNLSLLTMSNMTNANIYLEKWLSNINNILLLEHKNINTTIWSNLINTDLTIDNKYFNQYNFTLAHLKTQCWFISNNDYDLVAFTSRTSLDPIVLWVIEKESASWRKYHQLALYSYRSNKDLELIRGDILAWHLTSFLDLKWRYKSEWLSNWKCNQDNWFIIPISSKFYLDQNNTPEYSTTLKWFKVITEKDAELNIPRYWHWYLEFQLIWDKREELKWKTIYQVYSKSFNY